MTDIDALLAVNAAYYEAFESRNLEAMRRIWAEDGVSCVHPGWPALIGAQSILASYRDIFRNSRQEPIGRRDEATLVVGDDGRVFCVETVGSALLVATNCFRRIDQSWRMVHHQASPLAAGGTDAKNRASYH